MTELDWTFPINVSAHALKRSRERLGRDDPRDIRAEIRSALLEGRVADRLPGWTRPSGKPGYFYAGFHYVWNDERSRCWVLAKGDQFLHVRTLYLEYVPDPPRTGDDHRLRRGFIRR